ncbi:MAG: hypothetical protein ACREFR_19580 [Limisphaerales bacterium]
MKLGKLLAAGKSIMSGHAEISYRSSRQIYLPKFGSAKNPFKSNAGTQFDETTPEAGTEDLVETQASTPAGEPNVPEGDNGNAVKAIPSTTARHTRVSARDKPLAGRGSAPHLGVQAPPGSVSNGAQPAQKPGSAMLHNEATRGKRSKPAAGAKGGEDGSPLQRLNALVRSAFGKAAGSEKSRNQKGPATQTELSLDAIKVIHNDLSDVDVEIVPIKSRTGATESPAPKKTWEIVGERLFGVEAS